MERRPEQNRISFRYAQFQHVQAIITKPFRQPNVEAAAPVTLMYFGNVGAPLIGVEAQPLVIAFI